MFEVNEAFFTMFFRGWTEFFQFFDIDKNCNLLFLYYRFIGTMNIKYFEGLSLTRKHFSIDILIMLILTFFI